MWKGLSIQLLNKSIEEEEKYQFTSFAQTDAKILGELLFQKSLKYNKPAAIEIRFNHLIVYRFFPDGTNKNNELWLQAKANTVDMLGISTLHLYVELERSGESLREHRMKEEDYARFGGGFPLKLKGSGVVGSICVSGLMHTEDHQVIIEALDEYFGSVIQNV